MASPTSCTTKGKKKLPLASTYVSPNALLPMPRAEDAKDSKQLEEEMFKNRNNTERDGDFSSEEREEMASVAEGIYASSDVSKVLGTLLGRFVRAYTSDNCIYEGVLETLSPEGKVVLKVPHRLDQDEESKPCGSYGVHSNRISSEIIFARKDVISLEAIDNDLEQKNEIRPLMVESFQTDQEIHQSYNGQTEERQFVDYFDGEEEIGDDMTLENTKSTGWNPDDMFQTNSKLFNVGSTFDPSMLAYTTELVKDESEEGLELQAKAEKIAKEIENTKQSDINGKSAADDDDGEEEAKYSAVHRPQPDRYLPPHRRQSSNTSKKAKGSTSGEEKPTSTPERASTEEPPLKATNNKTVEEKRKDTKRSAPASKEDTIKDLKIFQDKLNIPHLSKESEERSSNTKPSKSPSPTNGATTSTTSTSSTGATKQTTVQTFKLNPNAKDFVPRGSAATTVNTAHQNTYVQQQQPPPPPPHQAQRQQQIIMPQHFSQTSPVYAHAPVMQPFQPITAQTPHQVQNRYPQQNQPKRATVSIQGNGATPNANNLRPPTAQPNVSVQQTPTAAAVVSNTDSLPGSLTGPPIVQMHQNAQYYTQWQNNPTNVVPMPPAHMAPHQHQSTLLPPSQSIQHPNVVMLPYGTTVTCAQASPPHYTYPTSTPQAPHLYVHYPAAAAAAAAPPAVNIQLPNAAGPNAASQTLNTMVPYQMQNYSAMASSYHAQQ
ncbi:DgyrCDS14231 [Dimorphilus gyrociliatus]|uniref:DgyrCDS14231 n=1 Tax=Dimorphilus gyrociliatus TaxID=2664684 RepID=A0A7I8WD77_9ANNE|nr:DgyrCDS14231 [Dimorphilus gyrociliatus]